MFAWKNSLRRFVPATVLGLTALMVMFATACRTPASRPITAENAVPPVLLLAPGDSLEISFPGATNLSGMRRIGPEGAINMPVVGQVQAAGKTVADLQSELAQTYSRELNDPEVIVTLIGSANVVYVTGSVLRPGRVTLDRPLTVLEGIMEVGGFTPDANLKRVSVLRYKEGGTNVTWVVDLEPVYEGRQMNKFYLWPRDVVHVPKKVQWF